METSFIEQYGKARQTIFEMLKDRNYVITKPDNKEESTQDLNNRMKISDSEIIAEHEEYEDIHVFFSNEEDKMGRKIADVILNLVEEEEIDHIIVVSSEYTPFAEKHFVLKAKEMDIDIELFHFRKLLYNITKHELQPKIEYIQDVDRIKHIHEIFQIKDRKTMPNIRKEDPINRYYNGQVGELYKVMHKNGRIDYVSVI